MNKLFCARRSLAGSCWRSPWRPCRQGRRMPPLEVKIDNFTFVPQTLTIKPGTTVTWINEDDIPHTVASTGKEFRSKALDTDDKFSFTFTTAGTFEYFCSLHPHMRGTIVVEAAAATQ